MDPGLLSVVLKAVARFRSVQWASVSHVLPGYEYADVLPLFRFL